MLVLKPTDDKNLIKEYCEKDNIPFSNVSNLLLATDKDEVLGYCLFDIDKVLTVHTINPVEDVFLLDGILRSTLHVGCERGIVDAFYSDAAPIEKIKLLGFIKDVDEKRLDVDKLFGSCCGCK